MINDDPSKIEPVLKELQKNFLDQQTKQIKFRKQQLQNLLRGLKELRPEIHEAQEKDLGIKNPNLGETFYLVPIEKSLEHVISGFENWTKPRFVKTPLLVGNGSSKIVPEPFGTVLVIGSWNYPFFTALAPAFEAIAAGNCVALKPSELAPNISKVLRKLFEKYLDTRYYQIIEGGLEVAKKISTFKWDLIIFTGSPEKGRLVAKAAADNLVPVILELGGKSPCIIDQDANIDNAATRICSGKFQNCGQTCIAPDYILIHESIQDKFVNCLKEKIKLFYSEDPQKNCDYSRIITQFHAERQAKMIEEVKDKIIYGGNTDAKDRYIQPTIVLNPGKETQVMKEEIFGPILPIITYKDFVSECLNPLMKGEKPLALYYFGATSEHQRVLEQQTSSGAFVHNDVIMHSVVNDLPFGGVGLSGQSRLHGLYGFEACSHMKPILYKDTANHFPNHIRFPPYTDSKMKLAKFIVPFGHLTNEDVKSGVLLAIFIVLFYFVVIPQLNLIFGDDNSQKIDL